MGLVFVIATMVLAAPLQVTHEPNDNAGILSGPGYAFILAAPEGWLLDDVSGRKEGLPAVFYKRGDSWSRAKVVMYANPVRKSSGETASSIIAADVRRFHARNPGISVEDGAPVTVAGNRKLPVKVFRGTKAGDTEVVAYADESSCVVMIVLSGTPDGVSTAHASFAALLRSYTFITADVR
jgi:hypothetical protein